jgi:1-carboxybiuret hydrolase subunit AtzH-like protein
MRRSGLTQASVMGCNAKGPDPVPLCFRDIAGPNPERRDKTMEIDLPDVVAEVRTAFERYEKALVSNDLSTLNELFRDDPRTVRYGVTEILYGHDEIKSFRAARSPVALGRKLSRTIITTFGRNFAVVSTLYERPSARGKIGRQTQTWVKFPEGWCVVVGHVSLMEKPTA